MNLPLGMNCLSMARIILVSMIPSSLFVITVMKQDHCISHQVCRIGLNFLLPSSIKMCVSDVKLL